MKSIAVLLALAAGLSACASSTKQNTGLGQVNDLLGRIERVHVETQLSQEAMRAALTKLHVIIKPGFRGDPLVGYSEFLAAFKHSEEREQQLLASSSQMKDAAEPFFTRWLRDLKGYSSPDMRLRSRARLTQTRERFEAIVAVLEPTLFEYHQVNTMLRDHALFLGHDFNPSAVADIRDQVQAVTAMATQLDQRFEDCFAAARDYADATALPKAGTQDEDEDEDEGSSPAGGKPTPTAQ